MTTLREAMYARSRVPRLIWPIGLVVLLLSLGWMALTHSTNTLALAVALGAAAASIAAHYVAIFALRCPRCRTRWLKCGFLAGPFDPRRCIKFCPFCGVALDDPLQDNHALKAARPRASSH